MQGGCPFAALGRRNGGTQEMLKRNPVLEYGCMLAGTLLIGIAIKNIYDPVSMVTGGVSGIAIIIKELWGVPLWLTNTILNIPLFTAAAFMMGWKFIKRTLLSTVLLSVALYLLPEASFLGEDRLLAALFGGILSGMGMGLVLFSGCTTGGTDMLAALIKKKLKYYTMAQIIQVLDGMIVLAGASVFGVPIALYALIAIFCAAKVTDGMIEGLKFSKQAYIISDHFQEIADAIMKGMRRGVTSLEARGMYSNQEKKMLFCVVSRKEIVTLREIVAEFDRNAFLIVSDAREVFGEGFIEH